MDREPPGSLFRARLRGRSLAVRTNLVFTFAHHCSAAVETRGGCLDFRMNIANMKNVAFLASVFAIPLILAMGFVTDR
mgnify:CR=1 FL=1